MKLSDSSSLFLDTVRGVSSQAVVIGHGLSFVGVYDLVFGIGSPDIQSVAVVFFFFISGFLIANTVMRKKQTSHYSFGEYFIERFSRIYTAFIPSLFFVILVDLIYRSVAEYPHIKYFNLKTVAGNLLMLQDFPVYFNISSLGSGRPFWTLAIEWWFYLAFGWLVLMKASTLKSWTLKLIVLLPLLIVPYFNLKGRGNGLTYIWIFGALASTGLPYLVREKRLKDWLLILAGVIFSILAISRSVRTGRSYDLKFGVYMSLALTLALIYFQRHDLRIKNFLREFIVFLASYSFSLYLIHYSIMDIANALLLDKLSPWLLFALTFMTSNLVAWILAKFTEHKYKTATLYLKVKLLRKVA